MDEEAQRMIEQLSGGLPVPQGQPTDPSSLKGLSPEALAALFLVPGQTWKFNGDKNRHLPVPTINGQSGNYDIIHDKAGLVGSASLSWQPEAKNLHVDYISSPRGIQPGVGENSAAAKGNKWAHQLGTTEIRSLLKSLVSTFPQAETVDGLRISGARRLAEEEATKKPHPYGQIPTPPGYVGDNPKVRLPRQLGLGGAPGTKLTDFW